MSVDVLSDSHRFTRAFSLCLPLGMDARSLHVPVARHFLSVRTAEMLLLFLSQLRSIGSVLVYLATIFQLHRLFGVDF
jgi:hypothetical protein